MRSAGHAAWYIISLYCLRGLGEFLGAHHALDLRKIVRLQRLILLLISVRQPI